MRKGNSFFVVQDWERAGARGLSIDHGLAVTTTGYECVVFFDRGYYEMNDAPCKFNGIYSFCQLDAASIPRGKKSNNNLC